MNDEERAQYRKMSDKEKSRIVHRFNPASSYKIVIGYDEPTYPVLTIEQLVMENFQVKITDSSLIGPVKGMIKDLYRKLKKAYFETSVEI